MRLTRSFLLPFVLVIASGCAMIPPEPVVTGPTTATPIEPEKVERAPNGSIYQMAQARPLFEDRRPRHVGDIVTVRIQEKTQAAKNVHTATNRSSNTSLGVDVMPRWMPDSLGTDWQADASGGNKLDGKGSSKADNAFDSTITTTVIEVLANGNLRIAGNKEIAINRGSEYVRFSGVVDPRAITGQNTVLSTQVADARIEYRSKGVMDEVQTMGWLQRFFLNVSPF